MQDITLNIDVRAILFVLISWIVFGGILLVWNCCTKDRRTINKDVDNCNGKCILLIKKDFIYFGIIAGMVIVVLLTLTFANNTNAVNYFSFAGTLSSIILSVVAIFMTINSENESKDAKRQMDMSVQQLKDTAASVEKLWKNTVDDFQKKMDEQAQKMDEQAQKMDEQAQNMEKIFQQSQETYDLYQSLNEKMDEQAQNMKKVIDQSQKIYDQYQSLKIKIDEAFPAENLDKGNERWNTHIVEGGDQQ